MKVLCVLLALAAIVRSAPSTVDGVYGGTGYVGSGTGGTVSGGGGILSFVAAKTINTHAFQPAQVVSEKIIDVTVPPPPPPAPAKKTVIERTVIPQYVEKRVRVPTFVERTIRVPTYVERTIKVPAAPAIVEKEISHEEVHVPIQDVKVVQPHAGVGYHKVVSAGGGNAYGYGGGPVGYSFSAGGGAAGTALINSIFNIPIQLLNGIARGLTGGVSFSAGKAYSY